MTWPKGLDLRALGVFLETTRAGNMAEAARRLGMTQPAVSQYISKTEEAVGAPLLDRRLRPTRLTPAGEVLRDRAEALLSSAEQALAAVRDVGEQPLPELRIALPNSLATTLTPHLYDRVSRELGPGNFSLRAGQAIDHVRALMEREVDFVIASAPAENLTGIDVFPLFREDLILMLPPEYDGPRDSLSAIGDAVPLIRFAGHNVVGQLVERHLRRLRLSPPRIAEFDTAQGVAGVVAAGHGFAVTTPMCVLEGTAAGHKVTAAPMPGPGVSRTLNLLARKRELGPRAAIFATLCRHIIAEHVAPAIGRSMPWLGDGFQILEHETTETRERTR